MSIAEWAILTGEYPPQPGGVSDYTHQVATALAAAGDEVHVFAPPAPHEPGDRGAGGGGVQVHRLPDHFGKRGRSLIEAHLQSHRHGRLLVQYVPHAYGHRAMNWPFARWVRRMARSGVAVDVMFHEVAYPLEPGQPLKHRLLALVNRRMARWICDGSDRIFLSILGWERTLRELSVSKPMLWLPVPSNISTSAAPEAVAAVRRRCGGSLLIGHFGTYGPLVTSELRPALVALAQRDASRRLLILGRRGDEFAADLEREYPELKGRIHAPGPLDSAALADHLSACDLLVQPYPDGISCRRSSAMAGLALGVPIVSSLGHLTEPIWSSSGAVALAATPAPAHLIDAAEAILANQSILPALGRAGMLLYQSQFDLKHTVSALRD